MSDREKWEAMRLESIAQAYVSAEKSRTASLIELGRLCDDFVRRRLEHIPEGDMGRRKTVRADAVARMTEELETLGGKPMVNRWIAFYWLHSLFPEVENLPQGTLCHLMKWIDRDRGTEKWSVREDREDELREVIDEAVRVGLTARDVKEWMDDIDEEDECEVPRSITTTSDLTSTASGSDSTRSTSGSGSTPSTPAAKTAPKTAETPSPASTDSSTASPNSTVPTSNSPASSGTNSPSGTSGSRNSNDSSTDSPQPPSVSHPLSSPKTLAEQAARVMANDSEILALIFRREWSDQALFDLADNLIRFGAERNLKGLARMYHRIAPTVRQFYDETTTEDGRFKLEPRKEVARA